MRADLFNKFRNLDLPLGKYAIFGSGPMGIRGLKENNDIDVIVSKEVFNRFEDKPEWKTKPEAETWDIGCLSCGDIEILNGWWPGEWNIQELIKNAEIIDGLAFVKLEEVLKWKKMMNREKDQKDIEIIEKYLNETKE